MTTLKKTFLDVQQDLKSTLLNNFPSLDISEKSIPSKVIVNPLASELAGFYILAFTTSIEQSLRNADQMSIEALDLLGSNFQFKRRPASVANGFISFKINTLPSTDILIPSGTRVSANVDAAQGVIVTFHTTVSVTFIRDQAASFFDENENAYLVTAEAVCDVEGTIGNVPKFTIVTIVNPIPGVNGVINKENFKNGKDLESNIDYAERLKFALVGNDLGMKNGYLLTALSSENVISAFTIDAENPLMRRDEVLYQEKGGAVDIIINGDNLKTASDVFVYGGNPVFLNSPPVRDIIVITADPGGALSNNQFRLLKDTGLWSNSAITASDDNRRTTFDRVEFLSTDKIVVDEQVIRGQSLNTGDKLSTPNIQSVQSLSQDIQIDNEMSVVVGSYLFDVIDPRVNSANPVMEVISVRNVTQSIDYSVTGAVVGLAVNASGVRIQLAAGNNIGLADPGNFPGDVYEVTYKFTFAYIELSHFNITLGSGNESLIDWSPAGFEPDPGSIYKVSYTSIIPQIGDNITVTYRYNGEVEAVQWGQPVVKEPSPEDSREFLGIEVLKHATADVIVKEVDQIPIDFEMNVVPKEGADIELGVQTAVSCFVTNLVPGDTVFQSDIIGLVEQVEGVDHIEIPIILMRRGVPFQPGLDPATFIQLFDKLDDDITDINEVIPGARVRTGGTFNAMGSFLSGFQVALGWSPAISNENIRYSLSTNFIGEKLFVAMVDFNVIDQGSGITDLTNIKIFKPNMAGDFNTVELTILPPVVAGTNRYKLEYKLFEANNLISVNSVDVVLSPGLHRIALGGDKFIYVDGFNVTNFGSINITSLVGTQQATDIVLHDQSVKAPGAYIQYANIAFYSRLKGPGEHFSEFNSKFNPHIVTGVNDIFISSLESPTPGTITINVIT